MTLAQALMNYHVSQFGHWNQEKLTRSKVGTQIAFPWDRSAKLTIWLSIPPATQEPSPYLHPYRIAIRWIPRDAALVLATVPGYPAAVWVWNRTGWSSPGCYPENRSTHRVRGRVGTGPRFHITVPATFAPIKYLGSDRMMTWSICRLCNFSPSFTSRCQICDWTNICWIAVKEGDISAEKCGFSIAT
jgi:hypothetical protein